MIQSVAAIAAAISIAAGAFGAHAAQGEAADWLKTGSSYLLVHAVAVFVIGKQANGPSWLILAGSSVFAVTLYAMALGSPRWFGAITPVGGAAMIGGWLWLAWQVWRT